MSLPKTASVGGLNYLNGTYEDLLVNLEYILQKIEHLAPRIERDLEAFTNIPDARNFAMDEIVIVGNALQLFDKVNNEIKTFFPRIKRKEPLMLYVHTFRDVGTRAHELLINLHQKSKSVDYYQHTSPGARKIFEEQVYVPVDECLSLLNDFGSMAEHLDRYVKNVPIKTVEILPIKVPSDTKWESIVIQFFDGHEVTITIDGNSYKRNYKDMGFYDKRTRNPNKQWDLLRLLASRGGELSWKDSHADDKVKKKKQLLSEALKSYFRVENDPFYPYNRREGKSYKIKLTLIPESGASTPRTTSPDYLKEEHELDW